MAEILLFHHIQGLTPGMTAFADTLREAGHTVHTPDLFEGNTFATIPDGMAYVRRDGAPDYDALADAVAADLPRRPGPRRFLLRRGAGTALAQPRPGARGALLFETCYPITGEWAFGPWPAGVPVQVHGMDRDPFFAEEGGDLDAARELVATVGEAELFTYPGDQHLFADASLPSYDEAAAPCSWSGCWRSCHGSEQPLPQVAHGLAQRVAAVDDERRGELGELAGVPREVAGRAGQPGPAVLGRCGRPEAPRQPPGHLLGAARR